MPVGPRDFVDDSIRKAKDFRFTENNWRYAACLIRVWEVMSEKTKQVKNFQDTMYTLSLHGETIYKYKLLGL